MSNPMPEDELDWRQRARCRDEDPNRMQPEVATAAEVDAAMELCAGCPVWLECELLAESQLGGAYGVHAGKWYGDPPQDPAALLCGWCNADMTVTDTQTHPLQRATRAYCGTRCRVAAHRARQAMSA